MDAQDPDAPSQLLDDLESIRSLLDETEDKAIPLLRDVIADGKTPRMHTQPIPADSPRPSQRNPFLPYASLARLAEERQQLEQELAPLMAQVPTPAEEKPTSKANPLRRRLREEGELVLQDVIDELMPSLESALRYRLRGRLEILIDEQLRDQHD